MGSVYRSARGLCAAVIVLSTGCDQPQDGSTRSQAEAEVKQAVIELIQSIEYKAAEIDLPEGISKALTTVKEKLVAFRDYLEGEVEQAKLDERLNEIKNSVKEALGT